MVLSKNLVVNSMIACILAWKLTIILIWHSFKRQPLIRAYLTVKAWYLQEKLAVGRLWHIYYQSWTNCLSTKIKLKLQLKAQGSRWTKAMSRKCSWMQLKSRIKSRKLGIKSSAYHRDRVIWKGLLFYLTLRSCLTKSMSRLGHLTYRKEYW